MARLDWGVHRPYLLLVILIVALGPLQFGFHLAELNAPEKVINCSPKPEGSHGYHWTGFTFGREEEPATPAAHGLPQCFQMTKGIWSLVQSIYTIGGLVGALSAGPISSSRGRLVAMRFTALFAVLGSVIEAGASKVSHLILGRFLTGIAAGASTVVVPMYISEVAPPSARGVYGFMTQISINVGIVMTQTLGYNFSYGSAWRWILVAGLVVAIVHAVGLTLVVESPAWLAARGHSHKAKEALQLLRGKDVDISEEIATLGLGSASEETPFLGDEHAQSQSQASTGRDKGSLSALEVMKDKFYRPAIIAVVGVMVAQQLCGINSIVVYSVGVLEGLLPFSSSLVTVMISCVNTIATLLCSPLPDRLGRKTCLLLSIAGQGISSFIMAVAILMDFKLVSAAMAFTFVASFAVGLGPVPFMLASEMVGQDAVSATQSWALASNYIATFAVVQTFPLVNEGLNAAFGGKGYVYLIFAALAAMSFVFISWRVPETKGKKDVDEVWGRTRRID